MKYALVALTALVTLATTSSAQRIESFGPEVRPFFGVYVPMGLMRDDFRAGLTIGGQAALELSDYWHVLGTIGWTNGKNRLGALPKEKTYLIHYDVGAEANLLYELQKDWLVKPFGGVGVGARTYDYGADAIDSRTCTSAYAAMGSELQKSVLAFRIEARQYASCFESPITGAKNTRIDGMFSFGLAYHIR